MIVTPVGVSLASLFRLALPTKGVDVADKWADYLISMVQYNVGETHIVKVLAHTDDGDTVGVGYEETRARVVQLVKTGYTFVTIYKNDAGKYDRGAEVRIVRIEGSDYIRTDADATKKDNLGSLPRF